MAATLCVSSQVRHWQPYVTVNGRVWMTDWMDSEWAICLERLMAAVHHKHNNVAADARYIITEQSYY